MYSRRHISPTMRDLAQVVTAATTREVRKQQVLKQKKKIQIPYGVLKLSRIELQKNVEMSWAAASQKEEENDEDDGGETKEKEEVVVRHKISNTEITDAFNYFSRIDGPTNVPSRYKHKITSKDVTSKLKRFWPGIGSNEIKALIREPIDLNKLTQILNQPPLTNDDPLKEAFSVFDPNDTGFVDMDQLTAIMQQMGYSSHITPDDVKVLLATGDKDGDGRISFEDFKRMVEDEPKPVAAEPSTEFF